MLLLLIEPPVYELLESIAINWLKVDQGISLIFSEHRQEIGLHVAWKNGNDCKRCARLARGAGRSPEMRRGLRSQAAVTLRDVAKAAGVSVATASRALAGSSLAKADTVRAVEQAASRLGYRTNTFARALKTRRSRLVGLTVHNLDNASFQVLASVVQARMQAAGYQVILTISGDDPAAERELLETLEDHGIDGLITVPTGANGDRLRALEQAGVAVICVVRRVEEIALETVLAGDLDGAYEGTRRLIELGHRRIGLIVGLGETTSGRERLAGYRRALHEAGLSVERDLIQPGRYLPATGVTAAEALLSLPTPPTALFVANHESSVGVLRVVAERGLTIPDDLSLLFYEDSPWFAWQKPAMSVIDSGAAEMANLAVDRLLQRLEGAASNGREYRIGARLVERASCRAPNRT